MTCFVSHTSVDCRNAFTLSEWWREALGYVMDEEDPNEPGHDECLIRASDTGHTILFIEVPEDKTVKNRLHFDVRPRERSREEEVAWLLEIGATEVADHRRPDGSGWRTLADPEGNEFCVLMSLEQRAAAGFRTS
jgi:catechol 2,3-dioxygenase-like lactoylglutathione lyase family enzyme